MKKSHIIIGVIGLLLFLLIGWFLLPFLGIAAWWFFGWFLPSTLNSSMYAGDPCYQSSYPGKGPQYSIIGDRVCIDNMPAKHCVPMGWGEPCENVRKTVEGADPETFVIHATMLSSDDQAVFIGDKRMDFDRKQFRYVGGFFFVVGDDVYKVNSEESGYVVVPEIDGITFEKVDSIFYKDSQNVYTSNGLVCEGINPENFHRTDNTFYKNNEETYMLSDFKNDNSCGLKKLE